MTNFVNNSDIEQINTKLCVVAIIGDSVYDTSEFANISTDFLYCTLKYSEIPDFYLMLKKIQITTDFKYLNILRYFSTPNSKIFFDFKCSSDCCSGAQFINPDITLTVNKFVKLLLKRGANVVVGDHSMGALFKNWDVSHMGLCPIQINPNTTSGRFRMFGYKNDFINSIHPTLNQIGDITENNTDQVKIDFSNMSGTLVYSINNNVNIPVQLISQGYQIEQNYRGEINGEPNNNNQQLQPVHCEFPLFNGMIIVSSTHWCNLTQVQSDINEDKLKFQYTNTFGEFETSKMEQELSAVKSTGSKKQVQEYCSNKVRDICSGRNL